MGQLRAAWQHAGGACKAPHLTPAARHASSACPLPYCPAPCSAYCVKAKWPEPGLPLGWLRDLFGRYVPSAAFQMRRAFSHIVPLGLLNHVTTLCTILEARAGERLVE